MKTFLTIVVLLSLLGLLFSLTLPAIGNGLVRGEMTQTLSNMKQLHLATLQWTLDNQRIGDSDIRWTCSGTTSLTRAQWTNGLISGNYLSAADLQKLLSHHEKQEFWFGRIHTNVIAVFAVAETDPAETLFLATENWQGLTNSQLTKDVYPKQGFIVFRKGGSGAILRPRLSTATNLIGSGGMHSYLRLH